MTTLALGIAGLAGIGAWVLIVILLHFIKSDLDPIDTYISDYAIGDHGWLMQVAFYAVGLGVLAIAAGLSVSLKRSKRAAVAIMLTVVAGLGFIVAGTFTTDPTGQSDLTTEGTLHLLGALMVFPVTVANSFVLRGLFHGDRRWRPMATRIRWLPWALLVAFIVSFFAPGVPEGLSQRFLAMIIMLWFAAVSWNLRTYSA